MVILHADPARGGAERYTLDLAAALAAARAPRSSLLASSFVAGAGYPVGSGPAAATGPTRLRRYVRFLDALDAHLAPDALRRRPRDAAGAAVRRLPPARRDRGGVGRHRAPEAPHGPSPAASPGRPTHSTAGGSVSPPSSGELLAGPRPPVVLCLSEYVKPTVRKHYDLPADRLATLFNAVDTDGSTRPAGRRPAAPIRRALGIGPDEVVALMIAQDSARKGLREAILARAACGATPRRLVLVGRRQGGRPAATSALAHAAAAGRVALTPAPPPTRTPFTGPPTSSSCPPATTPAAWWCWRRWRWACRSSAPSSTAPARSWRTAPTASSCRTRPTCRPWPTRCGRLLDPDRRRAMSRRAWPCARSCR